MDLPWCLYIIETEKGALYTGITNNMEKRWQAHVSGKGSKFLRANKPKEIVHQEFFEDRSAASIREAEVKKLDRTAKLVLIRKNALG